MKKEEICKEEILIEFFWAKVAIYCKQCITVFIDSFATKNPLVSFVNMCIGILLAVGGFICLFKKTPYYFLLSIRGGV